MTRELVRQSDGKWAIYSTISDSLLGANLSPREALERLDIYEEDRRSWLPVMEEGRSPQNWDVSDIRSAIVWTWYGDNGCRGYSSDLLESTLKRCKSWTDTEVLGYLQDLIDEGYCEGPDLEGNCESFRPSRRNRGKSDPTEDRDPTGGG